MWLKVSILRRKKHCLALLSLKPGSVLVPALAGPEVALGDGNIHSLRAATGTGTWGQEIPSPPADLRSTLHPQVHSEGFLLLRSFPIWTFSKEICFWCMERPIKASLGNLLMLLQSCSAGMIACTGGECSEWRIMRRTFRLIQGWREAHIRNIKYELAPLIHHKCLI